MSDSSCEYIIYTPGRKQNVLLLHTVINPSPGPRQLILFVLPMKFCTQMEQNRRIPSSSLNCCFSAARFPFWFFLFCFRVSAGTGVIHYLDTQIWWHTETHVYAHATLYGAATLSLILPVWAPSFHGTIFFCRIRIPLKGFRSDHWSWVGGDGRRLLNTKQWWRRELHRGSHSSRTEERKGEDEGRRGDKVETISMKSTTQEGYLEGLIRTGERDWVGKRRRGGQPLSRCGACRGRRRCLSCCQGYW